MPRCRARDPCRRADVATARPYRQLGLLPVGRSDDGTVRSCRGLEAVRRNLAPMPVMMTVPTPPSPAIASIGVARPVVLAVGIGVELRAIAGVGNNRRCSRYGRSG